MRSASYFLLLSYKKSLSCFTFPGGCSKIANIAESPVKVVAYNDQRVVVNVTTLDVPNGTASVVLTYDGKEGVRDIVKIIRPPTPPKGITTIRV